VTVTRLSYPIDDVLGEDKSFQTILEAQTAGPGRRITQFNLQSDGDVIIRICEDIRKIVVKKVEREVNSEKGEDHSEGGEDDEGEECNICTCSSNGTQEWAVQDLLCLVDLYLVYLI